MPAPRAEPAPRAQPRDAPSDRPGPAPSRSTGSRRARRYPSLPAAVRSWPRRAPGDLRFGVLQLLFQRAFSASDWAAAALLGLVQRRVDRRLRFGPGLGGRLRRLRSYRRRRWPWLLRASPDRRRYGARAPPAPTPPSAGRSARAAIYRTTKMIAPQTTWLMVSGFEVELRHAFRHRGGRQHQQPQEPSPASGNDPARQLHGRCRAHPARPPSSDEQNDEGDDQRVQRDRFGQREAREWPGRTRGRGPPGCAPRW